MCQGGALPNSALRPGFHCISNGTKPEPYELLSLKHSETPMPGKAFAISLFPIVVGAGALCWLAPLQGFEASAETFVSASTQLFDATPVGGAFHAISPARRTSEPHEYQDVSAQIFDPDVFGGVHSKFSGTERIVSGPDAGQSKTEGRSVGTSGRLLTTPALEILPGPARQCEPGPSTRKHDPQYGELEQNHAAG
jgi:hypothetical protein